MGFLDKAKTLADQAIAKADEAMNTTTGASGAKQAEPFLRDLGVLALLEATGRAPVDLADQRQRCLTALGQIEAQGPVNLAMTSMAPPAPGVAGGAPPPPGAAAAPPPPGSVAPPPPPGSVSPPPAPGAATPPPPAVGTDPVEAAPIEPPPAPGVVTPPPPPGGVTPPPPPTGT